MKLHKVHVLQKMTDQEKTQKFKEIDIFKGKETLSSKKSPFFVVTKTSTFQKTPPPSVSLAAGFYKSQARTDAIYILRYLANQALRNASNKVEPFLKNIQREINIKSGTYEAELMARDALIHRFLSKDVS